MELRLFWISILAILSFLPIQLSAQELEPRAITNLPVGMNFVLGGYGFSRVNTLLDPTFPIPEIDSQIHSVVGAYARSINFFGMSSKVDLVVPYISGLYEGEYLERNTGINRSGFADLRLRFSFNFIGSRAMDILEYQNYHPDFVSGISIQIVVPTGFYEGEYLVNIGSNRWVLKPQWGMAKKFNSWTFEAYLGLWLYGENNDFLQGNSLEQDPLFTIKGHAIKSLKANQWISFSVGYAVGGNTHVNGTPRDTEISTLRLAFMYTIPVSMSGSLKFSGISGIRFEKGSDYNGLGVIYQYKWLDKRQLIKLSS